MDDDPRYRRTSVPPVQPVQPVVAQPVVAQPVVAQPVVAARVRRTVLNRSFSAASAVAGVAAIALIVIGAVALARTDLEGPLDEPVVDVLGFTHTAALGIVEVIAGISLLLVAVTRARGGIMFVSVLIGIAAVVVAIEPSVGGDAFPVERSFAVIVAIAAAIVALTAALVPSVRSTTQYVETV